MYINKIHRNLFCIIGRHTTIKQYE
jgi:hypothetical protein